ncbi:MAG: LON peptidase substrate-binding domain-containing protein, partial [Planctomycetota bacterium]|nr:LON peptidase substrate-binding domain-containing protein [Planctomycetota bacterium]
MSPKKPTKKARSKKPASRRSAANRSKKAASRKGSRGRAARGGEEELEELLIVPVRNMILFPGVVLPLMLGRERSVVSVRAAVAEERPIGLLLQHDEQVEEPGPEDLYRVGTTGEIMRYWTNPDGRHQAVCQGVSRFEIVEYVQTEPVLTALVRRVEEVEPATRAIEARFRALKQRALDVLALAPGMPEDMAQAVDGIESPAMLADLVATFLEVPA